jgi:hypothetical protein
MSLFPGVATKSPYLLEFRAGRMKRDGKMVSPDTRKGLVAVHQVCGSDVYQLFSIMSDCEG